MLTGGVSVEVITEGEFTVMMSESLASVLLTNLLKNAFVHVTEGGRDPYSLYGGINGCRQ